MNNAGNSLLPRHRRPPHKTALSANTCTRQWTSVTEVIALQDRNTGNNLPPDLRHLSFSRFRQPLETFFSGHCDRGAM